MPEPRTPQRNRAWIPAALLCVPPIAAWALIGVDASGLSRTVDAMLAGVPPAVEAGTMLLSPLVAVVIGGVAVVRGFRAGEPMDRSLIALTVTAALLVAVTASAAWATGHLS